MNLTSIAHFRVYPNPCYQAFDMKMIFYSHANKLIYTKIKKEKAKVDLKGSFLFTLKVLIFKSRDFTLKFLKQKGVCYKLCVTLKLTGNLTALYYTNSAFDRTNCKIDI